MTINQGEIWLVEFFPNIGNEIGKKRPAIVVNDNSIGKLPLKTIVPITEWSQNYAHYPWMIQVAPNHDNGLSKMSAIDCFQVRNFSEHRFERKIGVIETNQLKLIHQTLLKTMNLAYTIC